MSLPVTTVPIPEAEPVPNVFPTFQTMQAVGMYVSCIASSNPAHKWLRYDEQFRQKLVYN